MYESIESRKDVDIFCVSPREELFGLVILKRFLYSTLVISSFTVGGQFLIENEKNGLLFYCDDLFKAYQAIRSK